MFKTYSSATRAIPNGQGRIVNEGTPPPHKCTENAAPGRPSMFDVNVNTVWQCSCGTFWKMCEGSAYDHEGDCYQAYRTWVRVKNANGDGWKTIEIPAHTYLTNKVFGAFCTQHGNVRKLHRHYERV